MNEGPFRMPNQVDRNTHDRPVEESKPAEEPKETPKQKAEEPKKMQRSLRSRSLNDGKSKKPLIIGAGALVAVVLVVIVGWVALSNMGGTSNGIDSSKYQAVFFTNGQVYFGKLHTFNDEYMKLTDVFYLQTQSSTEEDSKNPQKTATDQNNPTLIKLGDEIHGPQDEMIISKDQVLFYENLKSDGKVSSTIADYNKTKK